MKSQYDDKFYESIKDLVEKSANCYANILTGYYQPRSVIDVGCGRGTWLSAFRKIGATRLVGIDGEWNQQSDIKDPTIEYHSQDLNEPIEMNEKFDLAISVEVAEHLKASSGFAFVESLTGLSDVIIFGSAFVRQGGIGHLNETYHSEWADFFASWNYEPFDIFRPVVWQDDTVLWWYQQNTFLYVNRDNALYQNLKTKNIFPIANKKFMNCVHPYLYAQKV